MLHREVAAREMSAVVTFCRSRATMIKLDFGLLLHHEPTFLNLYLADAAQAGLSVRFNSTDRHIQDRDDRGALLIGELVVALLAPFFGTPVRQPELRSTGIRRHMLDVLGGLPWCCMTLVALNE